MSAARRFYRWLDEATARRIRLLVLAGLAVSVWMALAGTSLSVPVSRQYVVDQLSRPEDIRNLYYAAREATWQDVPSWFVGPWNYPGIRYYRPLTSTLFLIEQRAFDQDFSAYNRVTWLIHGLNGGLLFLLVVSLFSHHPRARVLLGLIAVRYFATPASSVFFGVHYVINWWPAQNDATCLGAGLAFLILLDRYLKSGRRALLWGALASFAAAIGFKEMGYTAGVIALGLVWYRRGRPAPPMLQITAVSVALWALRTATVPKPYGQSYLQGWIFQKLLQYWGGPIYLLVAAAIWWHVVAGGAITLIIAVGLRTRLPVAWMAGASAAVAMLSAQFLQEGGTWAAALMPQDIGRLASVLVAPMALYVFWRYRRIEPGLWICASWLFTYLPSIHLINYHYYYWPGALLALTNTAFCACLFRWALELKETANWSLRWRQHAAMPEPSVSEPETVGAGR